MHVLKGQTDYHQPKTKKEEKNKDAEKQMPRLYSRQVYNLKNYVVAVDESQLHNTGPSFHASCSKVSDRQGRI
jgi:hypothetical protein